MLSAPRVVAPPARRPAVTVHSDSCLARWILLMFLLVCVDVADSSTGRAARSLLHLLFPLIGSCSCGCYRGGASASGGCRLPDRVLMVFFA